MNKIANYSLGLNNFQFNCKRWLNYESVLHHVCRDINNDTYMPLLLLKDKLNKRICASKSVK